MDEPAVRSREQLPDEHHHDPRVDPARPKSQRIELIIDRAAFNIESTIRTAGIRRPLEIDSRSARKIETDTPYDSEYEAAVSLARCLVRHMQDDSAIRVIAMGKGCPDIRCPMLIAPNADSLCSCLG
ncbi:hypothetical protein SNOG_10429 [Parastagonospora nodorum SN15]|uniref:Uncharacterized protein n=1 Tax=Phaeosphaeria nodorum (strain SN15 / ATCC MYA-4574 / FGSC 10173) TaxID=321614 RepID=Q0UCT5_PHANO|nr:hypothetical protein SNOG_10429 [Parastagonospora nodorum SN15]EAT81823.1 hypothetical protein SNOG_10429 [Parastagonospora nodorum SN15]